MRTKYKVAIGPSRVPGVGLGLFALTSKNVAARERKEPVFRAGEKIAPYGGRKITGRELNRLYDYKNDDGKHIDVTAPYGLAGRELYDAACIRGAGAYANDATGTGKQNNAELRDRGVYATTDIYKGDEIFVDYGGIYWAAADDRYATASTKYRPPHKKARKTRRLGQPAKQRRPGCRR